MRFLFWSSGNGTFCVRINQCRGNDVFPITCQGHRGGVCHIGGLFGEWRSIGIRRAESSLVVPSEVGGTAEWAVSRPSPHWISSGDSPHSSPAVFFLLAFPLFYLFILHLIIITLSLPIKKKSLTTQQHRSRRGRGVT